MSDRMDTSRRMETDKIMKNENRVEKIVRFCVHVGGKQCNTCETMPSTAFHQIQTDITCFISEDSTCMIADIGCPNSVISNKDKVIFTRNLSKFQQQQIQMVKTQEKFKFGPSGPYSCAEKLRFPLQNGSKLLWVEVALVQAEIPMLLGNNILKPLGAEIKLFPEGNGILKLKNTTIPMRETSGGHFTIGVADLGKLCETWSTGAGKVNTCNKCG
jgi:hypothetical protein